MIDKITPDTKVSEICELLEYMQNGKLLPISLELFRDMSGNFYGLNNDLICQISGLSKYLKSIKKPDERDYDKILEDPAAVKKILGRYRLLIY